MQQQLEDKTFLVEAAIDRVGDAPARIADVGDGTTARALADALPQVEVWANGRLEELPHDLDLVVADLRSLPEEDVDDYRRLLAGAADHLAPDGGVLVHVGRQVLEAERSELPWLSARLESLVAA